MPREPIRTWTFALVVVRHGDRFLLVQEARPPHDWYLPAGRVEAGESWMEGAIRETREEAGIDVELDGVLRVEHEPQPWGARVRVFFTGRPKGGSTPKSTPDRESLQARWYTLEEAAGLRLRSGEVLDVLSYVARGRPVYPLELLTREGARWAR